MKCCCFFLLFSKWSLQLGVDRLYLDREVILKAQHRERKASSKSVSTHRNLLSKTVYSCDEGDKHQLPELAPWLAGS